MRTAFLFFAQKPVDLWFWVLTTAQADQRFNEEELQDILAIITKVFEEEEGDIPQGVEDENLPKIDNKLLGAAKKKKRKAKKREE